jgi:hypothetical protein
VAEVGPPHQPVLKNSRKITFYFQSFLLLSLAACKFCSTQSLFIDCEWTNLLTGQSLSRVFNIRSGYLHAATLLVLSVKLSN